MIGFKKNKIQTENKTVGEQFYLARTKQNISLKRASKKTKIKLEYLKALELGNYNKLPSGMYEKKYLKEYTNFLGLDKDELLNDFQKEKQVAPQSSISNISIFSKNKLKRINFIIFPHIIKNIIIVAVVIVCFGYLGYCVKSFVSPPDLSIQKPKNDFITNERQISIIGETESDSQIYINGNSILTNNNGGFTEKIALKKGVNTITITAQKKYSKKNIVKKQILVK